MKGKLIIAGVLTFAQLTVNAQADKNKYRSQPLISSIFTADPSAHVFNKRIYVYPSHDIEAGTPSNSRGDQFAMRDYRVLSMDSVGGKVTDHGVAPSIENIPWASQHLWAPDAAFANNRYYLYFPARDKQDIFRIGVATSRKPEGPFIAEKEPISGTYSMDPCVFKDDDGSFYLYLGGIWGGQLQGWKNGSFDATAPNPAGDEQAALPRMAKLSANMKNLAQPLQEVKIVDSAGRLYKAKDTDKRFFEASWVHKYKGRYYFSYSTGDTHKIVYAVGDNPYGPFTYTGVLLDPVSGWTNHHSVVEKDGKWFLFYHDTQLSGKDHLRNVKVSELTYNEDGTIQKISAFK